MPLKTPNDGAAQERAAIKRYVNRKSFNTGLIKVVNAEELLNFIDTRAARASKKPGGLGRHKK